MHKSKSCSTVFQSNLLSTSPCRYDPQRCSVHRVIKAVPSTQKWMSLIIDFSLQKQTLYRYFPGSPGLLASMGLGRGIPSTNPATFFRKSIRFWYIKSVLKKSIFVAIWWVHVLKSLCKHLLDAISTYGINSTLIDKNSIKKLMMVRMIHCQLS